MTYRVKRATAKDHGTLRKLHRQTFGGTADMVSPEEGYWWIVREGERAVAFAGLTHDAWEPTYGYLIRAGVLRSHRGHGLQFRLIRARERFARREGFAALVSDTTDNPASENNLQRAGFSPYTPRERYGMRDTIYWRKLLG